MDARRFIARYAYGTADVPLAKLLEPQGIRLQWKTAANIPTLEVRTRKQGDTLAHGAGRRRRPLGRAVGR